MIESRRRPTVGGVARLASLRKVRLHMVWVLRVLEVAQVTADAIRRSSLEPVPDVACRAGERGMHSREGKPGVLQVVKRHPKPIIEVMTFIARSRKTGGDMAWTIRILIIGRVAGIALRGQSLELRNRCAFVTGSTVQRGVCSEQRKSVGMILNLLNRDLPSFYGVALLTSRSELTLVNVGVAIGAFQAYVAEDRLRVALDASHALVHAPQRITRLIVVELWKISNRLPSIQRVTVLARNIEGAVWTSRLRVRLLRLHGTGRY